MAHTPGRRPAPTAGDSEPVDEASAESFPASDPPSFTPANAGNGDDHADEAKGMPHSDRHATETAAGRAESQRPAEQKH